MGPVLTFGKAGAHSKKFPGNRAAMGATCHGRGYGSSAGWVLEKIEKNTKKIKKNRICFKNKKIAKKK